jgi:DNA-binding GntR family transcriptional regulator
MQAHAQRAEWMGMIDLNRQFHFLIFELSPYKLILEQVARLWDLAEPFIVNKLALRDARLRTCEEHALLIDALDRRDREACVQLLHEHRSSTAAGLPYDLPAFHTYGTLRSS